MPKRRVLALADIVSWLQWGASALVAAAGLGLAAASVAGAVGALPLIEIPLRIGAVDYPGAGLAIEAGLAGLLLAVAATLPSGIRTLRLERSHRDFQICISDVSEAYRACHAADRAGTFTLSREFDAVKERIRYLRAHPDLGNLEPEVLEVAAEMSYVARDLAGTYSDEKVSRARAFLVRRQEEIAAFEARIEQALATCAELRRHRDTVDAEAAESEIRLARLETEFADILADLGFTRADSNGVIALSAKPSLAGE